VKKRPRDINRPAGTNRFVTPTRRSNAGLLSGRPAGTRMLRIYRNIRVNPLSNLHSYSPLQRRPGGYKRKAADLSVAFKLLRLSPVNDRSTSLAGTHHASHHPLALPAFHSVEWHRADGCRIGRFWGVRRATSHQQGGAKHEE